MPGRESDAKGRLNIYVSRGLWRRVKLAAAERDLSVSEYCALAIEAQLGDEAPAGSRSRAVAQAREFQRAHFGTTTMRVSTAELLRAARDEPDQR